MEDPTPSDQPPEPLPRGNQRPPLPPRPPTRATSGNNPHRDRPERGDVLARYPIPIPWSLIRPLLFRSPINAVRLIWHYATGVSRAWMYNRKVALPAKTRKRRIYFKLPLKPIDFHWHFDKKQAFLNGKLSVTLNGPEGHETLRVFEKGNVEKGWQEIGGRKKIPENEIYFGFCSRTRHRVSTQYTVSIHYETSQDLTGIGPAIRGYLPAGSYTASGVPTIHYTEDDTAFLEHSQMQPLWDLTVTENRGWMSNKQKGS